jgi:5-methyltetrahydrofolate--homocysteine methyltransferase
MAHILDALNDRVLLGDGGFGTSVQDMDLDVEKDFHGHENLYNYLVRSNPDVIRKVHRDFLTAGADVIIGPVFGSTPGVLDEFGLGDQTFGLNKEAMELMHEVIEEFKGDGRDRFVAGPIGPGTKLPSLGHIDYDTLEDDYTCQCDGLIAGGVDVIMVVTCQDPLQIKAALNGAKRACENAGTDTPIVVMVTVETTGTMLVGTDIAAAAAVVKAYDVPLIGLNCATGPVEMQQHVAWLSDNWPGQIGIWPNAGLPELVKGKTFYPLMPQELADWQERFIEENGINLIGGCCGSNATHIEALDVMLRRRSDNGAGRPVPSRRTHHWVPAVASLYTHVPLTDVLRIDDACASGDNEDFRASVEAEDWDGCVALARVREKAGGQILAIGFEGFERDETADMEAFVSRLRGSVSAALLLDAEDPAALTAALKLYGGKATVGGVNFAAGDEAATTRLELARRFGAAVLGRAVDENGPAHDIEGALAIARRLHTMACDEHGLTPSDLMIEVPALSLATAAGRHNTLLTLDAIEAVAGEFPECRVVVSLSDLTAGIEAAVAEVMQSVFVDLAKGRGLTAAFGDVSKILPAEDLRPEEYRIAEELILGRRLGERDPLDVLAELILRRPVDESDEIVAVVPVDERLKTRIIEGERQGLEADLDEALVDRAPLDIINETLLDGMKVVGDLFGDGKMPLPFVLEAAQTMKAAVAHLEPHMETVEGTTRGTIVLATVKGDIHDIGKNLVDIILTNNGYRTVNIGARQPIEAIMAAAREEEADAVGMSGLLIRSAVIMRENLEEMSRNGLDMPVLLGGAALSRKYVEEDCVPAYDSGRVAYAGDVFEGLDLMEKVATGEFDAHVAGDEDSWPSNQAPGDPLPIEHKEPRPVDLEEINLRRNELHTDVRVPEPPFWGARTVECDSLNTLLPLLNERVLFQFQWGFRKSGRTLKQWQAWAAKEVRPILHRVVEQCTEEKILHPQAVYGYWKCASEGDALVLFDEDGESEVGRFDLPRQQKGGGLCIADFIRDTDADGRDVVALQAVTVGQQASDAIKARFEADRYQDYLYLHGFSVEMTEAMAEYVHRRVRDEFGIGGDDANERDALLSQGYRGARYSFGYPACPNLEDQAQILDLLDAGRIGVKMSDQHQLHPELSTTALVLHHPQARYFSV